MLFFVVFGLCVLLRFKVFKLEINILIDWELLFGVIIGIVFFLFILLLVDLFLELVFFCKVVYRGDNMEVCYNKWRWSLYMDKSWDIYL